MIRGHTVGVVIPCYNEEEGLRAIFPRVPAGIDEVIVVNNNSTDGTEGVAREHGAQVVFEAQPGYGRAYQAGFAAARSDIIVTMDGDGQYPIEDVPRLVGLLLDRNLDCVSGSRFPIQGVMSLHRRVGNRVLTLAANILFQVNIRDTQSGMWVFWRDLLSVVSPTQPSMPFSQEFKLKVVFAGLRFGEAHIVYRHRKGESTLHPLKHGWENIRHLLQLRLETLVRPPQRRGLPSPVRERATEPAQRIR